MDEEPKLPLVLFEWPAYQRMFASLAALLDDLEAIDVRDGTFTVFDANGRRVLLGAAADRGSVVLSGLAPPSEPETLRAALADAAQSWAQARFGVSPDGDLEHLLRAFWRVEFPGVSFPPDVASPQAKRADHVP